MFFELDDETHEVRVVPRPSRDQCGKRVDISWVGAVKISTVFLAIDHSRGSGGPPILFETMIFEGVHNGYQERYSTWGQAVEGHARAVALVRASLS